MSAIVGVSKDATPQVKFVLPVSYKHDGDWIIATCDALDVVSQGKSQKEAHAAIVEAVSLFLETCYEMGTLGEVLRQLGFHQMQPQSSHSGESHEVIEVPMELVANVQNGRHKSYAAC
ncbi:MAG: hypothetical protein QM741_04770 [Rudaea sp.]|uniref:type II toxin-antitoxin system HicB family antitoxin n=1 Tax=Rudaea sp. TaxID=2136325 RepID=UPI0039E45839